MTAAVRCRCRRWVKEIPPRPQGRRRDISAFSGRDGLFCPELVREEYEHNIPLKNGAAELLVFLDSRGIPYGVATATYKGLAVAAMKRCGVLDRMSFLLTDKEYPNGKGFPDIFLGAAELLGTSPAETLVVEDSLHCIETAKAAGFATAAVYEETAASEWEQIKALADYSFTELGELRALFEVADNE